MAPPENTEVLGSARAGSANRRKTVKVKPTICNAFIETNSPA
jgi:hypothetical protein